MLSLTLLSDDILSIYGFYAMLLAFEFVVLSFLTGQERLHFKAFMNPEDAARWNCSEESLKPHPDVERTRRIVRNDMENIPMFLLISALYAMTGPHPTYFTWIMRLFTFLRIAYVIAYKFKAKAPTRSTIYSLALYFLQLPLLLSVLYSSFL